MLYDIPLEFVTVEALKKLHEDGTRAFVDGDARLLRITSSHVRPSTWFSYIDDRNRHEKGPREVLPGGGRVGWAPA